MSETYIEKLLEAIHEELRAMRELLEEAGDDIETENDTPPVRTVKRREE